MPRRYDEDPFYLREYERLIDAEMEHVESVELARRERLDDYRDGTDLCFKCSPCECGGLCPKCQEAA